MADFSSTAVLDTLPRDEEAWPDSRPAGGCNSTVFPDGKVRPGNGGCSGMAKNSPTR